MCGLAGYLGKSAADEVLGRMTGRLEHRGPDAAGYYRDGALALGHRRLSILRIITHAQFVTILVPVHRAPINLPIIRIQIKTVHRIRQIRIRLFFLAIT